MTSTMSSLSDSAFVGDLGYGSFGRAYIVKVKAPDNGQLGKADDKDDKPSVVVKEYDPNYVRDVCGVPCIELILQEAMAMQRARHPNVLRTFNVFANRNKLYHIQEYCHEGNLQTIIDGRNGKLMSEPRVQHWFGQLASAISFLHDKQILHCGIKAQNILMSANYGCLKVADPGTVHLLVNSKKKVVSDTIADTLLSLPPEFFDASKTRGPKIDVWMMGVVVYQMATLQFPFPRSCDVNEIKEAVLNVEPTPIDVSKFSTDLCDMVRRMMEKDQDKRYELNDVVDNPYIRAHTFAGGLRRGQPMNRIPPSIEKIERQVAEMDNSRFHKKWSRVPTKTLPFKSPSAIRAILTKAELKDKFHSVMIVCADGEVLNLAMETYDRVQWRGKVYIHLDETDPKDKFGVFHATYDEKSDRLFFALVSPHRDYIYYIKRSLIMPDEEALGSLKALAQICMPLEIFTPASLTGGRQFWGLLADSERRLLYAGSNKDISIWSLGDINRENPQDLAKLLISVMPCNDIDDGIRIEPRHFALSRGVVGQKPKLAVSDFINNRVCIFYFAPESDKENENEAKIEQPPEFEQKTVVASKLLETPMEIGSVYGPCDLCFDASGNLYATDYSNKRIQMFSFKKESSNDSNPKDPKEPKDSQPNTRCVWTSNKVEGGPYRVVIAKGFDNTFMIVGQHSGKDIICFQ